MIRLSSLIWLALVAVTGFVTFKVKYAVQDIEEEFNRVRKQTVAEQQEIHLLTAEWTALTQPDRLAELNRRFLTLSAVSPRQLQQRIEDIALRPPPAAPPDMLVAANPDPAEPAPSPASPAANAVATNATPVKPVPAAAKPASAKPELPVRLATAGAPAQPRSLDQLIAAIAETR